MVVEAHYREDGGSGGYISSVGCMVMEYQSERMVTVTEAQKLWIYSKRDMETLAQCGMEWKHWQRRYHQRSRVVKIVTVTVVQVWRRK